VRFIVPGDPNQRTGGYRYVSRLVGALHDRGVNAVVRGLEGRFPIPDPVARSAMDAELTRCKDGTWVVLDGLAMGGLPGVIEKHSARLNLLALVHHPLADETGIGEDDRAFLLASETRALAAVSRVITTSRHTAVRLNDFRVPPEKIRVVEPGADTVSASIFNFNSTFTSIVNRSKHPVSDGDTVQLLCVAGLSPRKAQHHLVEALSGLQQFAWHCTLVGSTERDPEYSQQLGDLIHNLDLTDRISLAGELGDEALAEQYRNADLFVLPSLYEGYGMVIDEALAAGLPVITTDGGALASTGDRPGIRQYPAGSVDALRECLQVCFADRQILQEMADATQRSQTSVRHWSDAAAEFEAALDQSPEMHEMHEMRETRETRETRDHSQFEQQWLALREPADHRARNRALLEQLQSWLKRRAERRGERRGEQSAGDDAEMLRIVDLGSGAGSNGLYLSDKLPGAQHWTLLDQDPSLLAEARSRLASEATTNVTSVEGCQCSLDADNLADLIPAGTHVITASALIDLMSANWLDALAGAAEARHAAVYIALSYAGEFQLSPQQEDDDLIRSLVNDHQHGDKGSGAALGPEATDYLKDRLQARGYEVAVESSPWNLDGDDGALQAALICGWCEAAMEQAPTGRARIEHWQSLRLRQAETGQLKVQVAHYDLFARPASSASHD